MRPLRKLPPGWHESRCPPEVFWMTADASRTRHTMSLIKVIMARCCTHGNCVVQGMGMKIKLELVHAILDCGGVFPQDIWKGKNSLLRQLMRTGESAARWEYVHFMEERHPVKYRIIKLAIKYCSSCWFRDGLHFWQIACQIWKKTLIKLDD